MEGCRSEVIVKVMAREGQLSRIKMVCRQEEEEEEEEESEKGSVFFFFFLKIRNRVISWVGGMGDVKKVGQIEIEDNGEKIQINTIVHRGGRWVGLKHTVRQGRRKLTK